MRIAGFKIDSSDRQKFSGRNNRILFVHETSVGCASCKKKIIRKDISSGRRTSSVKTKEKKIVKVCPSTYILLVEDARVDVLYGVDTHGEGSRTW